MKCTLDTKEIIYFYEFLFRFEQSIRKEPTGYKINAKEVNKFKKTHNITLDDKCKVIEHCDKNKFIFKGNGAACFHFLKHIRNAFAHGQITKEKNYYIIEDKYKGKYTMYGRINKELFPELMEVLENTRKK